MKIEQFLNMLKTEEVLERTPTGRAISEEALEAVRATLDDEKNYGVEAFQCRNCGIILSSLIIPEGCMNCGYKQPLDT